MILGLRDQGLIQCMDEVVRATTGFAGGMGRSYQGPCGALSAGIISLGLLYGRVVFLMPTSPCAIRVKRLVERFNETRSSNICKDLIAAFWPPDSEAFKSKERKALCGEIVRDVGNWVAEIAFWKPPDPT